MDVKLFYRQLAAKQAELTDSHPDGAVYLVSLPNPAIQARAGVVCEAPIEIAARNIVKATHKLATAEQITAYHQEQSAERVRIQAAEAARRAREAVSRLNLPRVGVKRCA